MQTSTRFPLILKLLLGLGGVWLARHRNEPKRKLKRKPRPEDRSVLSNVAQRVTVQRLAEPREIRQESTEVELCLGLEVELEMGIRRGRN